MYAGIRWWTVLLLVLGACGDDSGVHHPPDAPREHDDAEVDAPRVLPATAANDSASMLEDGAPVVIAPLANDTAGTAAPLAITSFTLPAHGMLERAGDAFTYSPSADFNGTDEFTYTVNGESTATVAISVGAVNDAPSFTKGADQTVLQGSGMKVVAGWATAISAGPGETQAVTFTLTPSNPALFAVAPTVSADGTLAFMPAPGASGTTTVTIVLTDDGGTDNSGVDAAPAQTFTILIKAPA